MPRVQQDREAYQAGYDAGARGERASKCPYRAGTAQAFSWRSGFIEGQASRKTNTAGKLETVSEQDLIARATEILTAAYTPGVTRSGAVEAIGEALDVLAGSDDPAA
ncbi:MAG: Rmf/CrpP family protein [Candidatus Solibacter sp.]|jgi:ribosome modulation factor